jgi:tetratricopeptide (TPR) repeat protein
MANAGAQSGDEHAPHAVHPASFDSILASSRKQLPEHAARDIATLEKSISALPDSTAMAPKITELAKAWQQHKQLPVAAYYYAKAAKLENSEKKLNFAGQFFLDLMRNATSAEVQAWEAQEAIACLSRSLEINPSNDTVKMALAAGYVEGTSEPMQGIQLLLGITRERPDDIPANLMLGKMAIQSGQYDKAVARFETVLKNEPENTEATYFLAEAYKGKGDKAKAIELLEKCKKLVNKPDFSKDIDAYINSFK